MGKSFTEDLLISSIQINQALGFSSFYRISRRDGRPIIVPIANMPHSSYKLFDDCETLEIAREEVLTSQAAIPSSMRAHAETLQYFIAASHHITSTMLSALSNALNRPEFMDAHSDAPNDCGLKFEAVPTMARLEDVPDSEHTDSGTLTLLFCPEYTTELRVPGTTKPNEKWEFIEPRKGCAIVNVADSLQRLSGGELMSSLHRVGQPTPGAAERFCLLYYLRPDSH